MARVNICGFETGDASEGFSSGGTFTVQTATVRTGTYALRTNLSAAQGGIISLSAIAADGTMALGNVATCYIRFYFLYATKPTSGQEEICSFQDVSQSGKAAVKLDSNGKLGMWSGVANLTQLGSTGSTALQASVWYCIEVKLGSGASGVAWEIRINGISEISGSDTFNSSANNGLWLIGANTAVSSAVDFYYDDVAIDDSAYPGPGSIVRLNPSADVAKTNWLNQAGSSTNLFQSVDDLASQVGHDSDSTYITTSTSGVVTYTASFPALSTRQIIGTINEIKLIAFGRRTGAQAVTYDIQIKPTSNAQTTTALDATTSYAMRALLYKAKGGTDALTIANVNTCQASFIHVQANAREIRCTCLALMLDLPGIGGPSRNIRQAVNRASVW